MSAVPTRNFTYLVGRIDDGHFICHECGMTLIHRETPQHVHDHARGRQPPPPICPYCCTEWPSVEAQNEHMLEVHAKQRPREEDWCTCYYCPAWFVSFNGRNAHALFAHGEIKRNVRPAALALHEAKKRHKQRLATAAAAAVQRAEEEEADPP